MAYQVTYVVGVTDPIERAACVGKVLKALCGIDVSWLRAHPEAPRLADAGIRIISEPNDTDLWHDTASLLRLGQATEPEYACAVAAERFVRGGTRGYDGGTRRYGDKQPLRVPLLKSIDDEQTRFTIATDLFDGDQERDLSHVILAHMLVGLAELDALCLRRHPEWPGIYDGRVRYEEEPVGQEDWADIPTCVSLGIFDCEDGACWRAAELNVRHGIKAYPTFVWRRKPNGSYLYHIIVARPDMMKPGDKDVPTEDPSRHLGMT